VTEVGVVEMGVQGAGAARGADLNQCGLDWGRSGRDAVVHGRPM